MDKYKIVENSDRYNLTKEVNNLIERGWRPQGGVSFVYHSAYRETWAQAMVKEQ
jgi:hypothetical protein